MEFALTPVSDSSPTEQNHSFKQAFPLPSLQNQVACEMLVQILREEIQKTGLTKAVVGLSGGIDSALSYLLACQALTPQKVQAILMPYKLSSPASQQDAQKLLLQTGGPYEVVEITPMAEAYLKTQNTIDKLRLANVLARLRMLVLYDKSAQHQALVVGTSNKTEILLGYSTLWGDMASAINPLGDLYKSQVRSLAKYLSVPDSILAKPPSADLWEGQSDEAELNMSYDFIDRILLAYVDQRMRPSEILQRVASFSPEYQEKASLLLKRVARFQYKRKMPVIAKISHRTIGREFRYPRDWNL